MAQLRDPQSGCPWDVKQTMESLTRYTIEEAYEVADAIANGDMHDIKDELGDLRVAQLRHNFKQPLHFAKLSFVCVLHQSRL